MLVSGWQLNGIFTYICCFPFAPQVGSNYSGDGDLNNPDRPSLNPNFTGPVIVGSPTEWFNPKAFVLPLAGPGTFGNVTRGEFDGPNFRTFDTSVFKNIQISERLKFQFRAELFNV